MLIYTDGRDVGDSACYLTIDGAGDRASSSVPLSDVFFTEITTSCGSQPCPTKNVFGVPI